MNIDMNALKHNNTWTCHRSARRLFGKYGSDRRTINVSVVQSEFDSFNLENVAAVAATGIDFNLPVNGNDIFPKIESKMENEISGDGEGAVSVAVKNEPKIENESFGDRAVAVNTIWTPNKNGYDGNVSDDLRLDQVDRSKVKKQLKF